MNILFLTIPVAVLAVAIVSRFLVSGSLAPVSKDERGVTLETVIITAVLALGAAGAGIIIYNVVADSGSDINSNSKNVCSATIPANAIASAATLPTCKTTA